MINFLKKIFYPWTEINRLRRDCAEAYQVIGVVWYDCRELRLIDKYGSKMSFTEKDILRAMDNLSSAVNASQRPHDDLLPWA